MARRSDFEGTELSRSLRALRDAAKLRQADVVAATSVSQAQLSRIERGQSLPSEAQVDELARLYRVDPKRRQELVQLAKDAQAGIRDTRLVVQRGSTLAMQNRWREIEGSARIVRSYRPALVIGVLQTVEYSSIVLEQPPDSDVVQSRARRQERLLAEPDRSHVLIQTEGALRHQIGSPEIMAGQTQRLVEASGYPNVRLGVIPASRAIGVAAGTAFHIYDDKAVVVGLEVASATLTEPADISHFRLLFERLAAVAVWDDEAREILERVRASVEGL